MGFKALPLGVGVGACIYKMPPNSPPPCGGRWVAVFTKPAWARYFQE